MPRPERATGHHRPVRSYVLRAGRMTSAQASALDGLWADYGVAAGDSRLDLDELFGRAARRVVEVGFGMGESLVAMAAAAAQLDFLGIEVYPAGVGSALLKARDAGVRNLRLICADAVEVFSLRLPPASVWAVNIFFPDPWPKKRHHKRRLLQQPMIDLLFRCLQPQGKLHIATDWAPYAQDIELHLDRDPRFRKLVSTPEIGDRPAYRPLTKYERRGLQRGHQVRDLLYTRLNESAL